MASASPAESNETATTWRLPGSTEGSSEDSYPLSPQDEAEIDQMFQYLGAASSWPFRSSSSTTSDKDEAKLTEKNSFTGLKPDDPRLNVSGPDFDRYLWIRMFVRSLEEQGIKRQRCGFLFRNLNVTGFCNEFQLQDTVLSPFMRLFRSKERSSGQEKHILRNFDGVVNESEMLIVLGRPGSGCSTFLKAISGELQGLKKAERSVIEYNGLMQERFKKEFRGSAVYNQEQEKHFPHLTVGQTLEFAAAARTASARLEGLTRSHSMRQMSQIVMAVLGLSHTKNTKVGNDFVRGVSGGERKRVSLAEMALAGSPVAAWDNSTRGLDSASALEFARSLRVSSRHFGTTHAVAIYQASQSIYELFDKAIVLYEGRQIYFGPASNAKGYFENMGWYCPPRQTTGDFLTSVTNPAERQAREGYEARVPRSAQEFEDYWLQSVDRKEMFQELERVQLHHNSEETYTALHQSHRQAQAKHMRPESPYLISIPMQVSLCTKRAYQRIWNDKSSTVTAVVSQVAIALIIGSIFYGTPLSTNAFFSKGSILFFAVLLNALSSITEINMLYEQRPIVEKHNSYAFYHPFAEALAGIVSDLPIKFFTGVCFNIVVYFLGGLTYTATKFFIFFLFIFITTLTMSAIFRTLAAVTKTISQAMAAAGIMILAIVTYTGFTLQPDYQHKWLFWIQYINPVRYAYEALLTNEVHGASYDCSGIVPPYGTDDNFVCPFPGAVVGERSVSGDRWVQSAYSYSYSHIWRNLGILCAFLLGFWIIYLAGTELNSDSSSTAEFLVFRRGHAPKNVQRQDKEEEMSAPGLASASVEPAQPKIPGDALPPQKHLFTWRNVTLDITIAGEPRRLLDNVSGWVRPGTLTALMGVSGAGKTTLLDTLAQRMRIGVLTGDMLINGKVLPTSFQRSTGYVQQQDLHLETSTVREALRFSAMLRQRPSVSKEEKEAFVESVIAMLGMQDFAEAVIGNPGEGLNVEQRKLLTIGVELAAKPDLLLFLDEPTSGLDSQSSWSICQFLRKLADNGQAVLSTIHQPSAILFQQFDHLLFLAKGGRTVYFGKIGDNSATLLNYFSSNGARQCGDDENPAEYMLEVIGAGPHSSNTDWPAIWNSSPESKGVQEEIDRIHAEKAGEQSDTGGEVTEFAMPLTSQIWHVTSRVFQQYWRSPQYIWGKFMLGVMSALFVGFSFYLQKPSQTGTQNQIFAIFMFMAIFSTLVQQIMPRFVIQRSLYEVRERPSKAYSWIAFIVANLVVEIPYQILLGILVWASWYFPVFGKNQSSERMGLMLLYCVQFMVFASTFAQMLIAALPDAATAGSIATLMFSLSLTFNGVLQSPTALPGFWIFMYRVSPLTYFVGGEAAVGIHDRAIECTAKEFAVFNPPIGQTCQQYLAPYLAEAPGYLQNPNSTISCSYCPLSVSDQYLANSSIYWSQRWRNSYIIWGYIGFNIIAAVSLYYLVRVKQWSVPKKGPMGLLSRKR